jgi:ferric-dicitrate binding protein FerR (iron transport regulator)
MADIALLIKKYLKEELDAREAQELQSWKEESFSHQRIFDKLTNDDYLLNALKDDHKIDSDEVARQKMHALIDAGSMIETGPPSKIRSIWPRLAVAAAILVLLAISAIFIIRNNKPGGSLVQTKNGNSNVTPGTFKATLQLADGRSIALDTATVGQLAQQGNTRVLNKNGQLVYTPSSEEKKNDTYWNTLSTSKGQTYSLLLSDGSRVTLNSESSVRFPVVFSGDVREVQVTGEVFFEIAHDASKPFHVSVRDINVQVLGTIFNVNAYADEPVVKTTLIAGSVRVNKGAQQKIIKPGQQAQVFSNEIRITTVDVDKITAWTQGYFRFKADKLSEAMRSVGRWYNVEVVFEGNASNVEISGDISRTANLSEVIKLLSLIDVEARLDGRKLILKAQ